MIGICIFVIHQNSTIMKPGIIITGSRARRLLAVLCIYRGFPTLAKAIPDFDEGFVRQLLVDVLDTLSKPDDDETNQRK